MTGEFDQGPGQLRIGDGEFLPRLLRSRASSYPADLFTHDSKTVAFFCAQVAQPLEDIVPVGTTRVVVRQTGAEERLTSEDAGRADAALGLVRDALGVSIAGNGLADYVGETRSRQGPAHFGLRNEHIGVLDMDAFSQNELKKCLSHAQGPGMNASIVISTELRPVQRQVQRPDTVLEYVEGVGLCLQCRDCTKGQE